MRITASIRTPYLKPKKGWKSIDLRDAVGKLTLAATRPDDTQLLRYIHQALSDSWHSGKSRKITVHIGGKRVCVWSSGEPAAAAIRALGEKKG